MRSDEIVPTVKAVLSPLSQTELVFRLIGGTGPVDQTKLTAVEIDALITGLARLRMTLKPEIDRDPPTRVQLNTVVDPRWRVQTLPDVKMVSVRHPGKGWFMFGLTPPEAAKLAHALRAASSSEIAGQTVPRSSLH
jgi:hypothetical protein